MEGIYVTLAQHGLFGDPPPPKKKFVRFPKGFQKFWQELEPSDVPGELGELHLCSLDPPHCPCPAFKRRGRCRHVDAALDLSRERGKKAIYEIKSALHKEVRRGDVRRAVHFARWWEYCAGKFPPKQYVKSIVMEETRNLQAAMAVEKLGGQDIEEAVPTVTSSVKCWEVPSRNEQFYDHLRQRFEFSGKTIPTWSTRRIAEMVLTATTPAEIRFIRHVVKATEDDEGKAMLWNCLNRRLKKKGGVSEEFAEAMNLRSHRYVFGCLMQLIFDAWDPASNESIDFEQSWLDEPKTDHPVILAKPAYVFDIHLWQGRARMKKYADRIVPGKPMPPHLDLRWAGGYMGLLWRHCAGQQFGPVDYKTKRWEDVEIPADLWELATRK